VGGKRVLYLRCDEVADGQCGQARGRPFASISTSATAAGLLRARASPDDGEGFRVGADSAAGTAACRPGGGAAGWRRLMESWR